MSYTYCVICGGHFSTDIKEHILAEHYDYLLAQCRGDKKLLKKWVNEVNYPLT